MNLTYSLNEIENFLFDQTGKAVNVRQTAPDAVRVRYLLDLDLTLTGHTDSALLFDYSLGWGANLIAKSTSSWLSRLKTRKLNIDPAAQTIRLNFDAFALFRPEMRGRRIVGAHICDNALSVELEKIAASGSELP